MKIYAHFCGAYDSLSSEPFKQIGRTVMLVKRRFQQSKHKSQYADMIDYVAKSQGMIALIDTLMMFQRVISNAPSLKFLFAYQEAALHVVLAIVFAREENKLDVYSQTGGLAVLVSGLKWPPEVEQAFSEKEWNQMYVIFLILIKF